MKEMLGSMQGKVVKVGRGGPESRTGQFLGGGDDYFALLTKEDGVLYVHGQHLKSVTEMTKGGQSFEAAEGFSVLSGTSFRDILTNLELTWVQINRGGPEKIEGVLNRVNEDHISVIVKDEIIRLPIFHIKSISSGAAAQSDAQTEENSSNNNSNSNSNKNSDNSASNDGGDFVARSRNRRR
ncbi:hypothetical protein WKH31_16280 [Metabacillus indicus]|uniref:hypothetical protein n=1 Tax=Metabacillus indicus TaxID=246786 RepID=UPI00317FEDF8